MIHALQRFFWNRNSLFCRKSLLLTGVGALALTSTVARADWPEFRGPWGDGHATAPGVTNGYPLHWSETENIRWTTPLPDRGYSTPVVMDGQVWLTTATDDGHEFFVFCLDAETGKISFTNRLFQCDKPEPLGNIVNTYASPSPVIEAGRVYVHFGSYGTACLDTKTFKVLWERQDLPCRHYRGPASSPILFENLLVLTFDGADLQYLVALDRATGKTVWKTDRSVAWNDENVPGTMAKEGDLRKAHSTPLIVKVGDQFQMISAGAKAAYAYDPRTGKELWRAQYPAFSAAARPLYRNGLAFINTGFGGPTELIAVRVDGHGDVTASNIVWRTDTKDKTVAKTASPVLVDDLLYMVSDDGMVTCRACDSGVEIWRERIGGNYAASPLVADGRIYFFNQQGKTTVLKPGRQFEALSTNVLSSGLMASPSASGKALFLRSKTDLKRVEQAK